MPSRPPLHSLVPSLIAALLVAATALYASGVQGDAGDAAAARATFVGIFLGASAVAALAGALVSTPLGRFALLCGVTTGLWAWGLLGIFSIGVPLLAAAALTSWSALMTWFEMVQGTANRARALALAATASVVVLAAVMAGLGFT